MIRSDSIKELAVALNKAQGEFSHAKKDSKNEFFKTKYADLASCIDAAKKPLADNGLSVSQIIDITETGQMVLETLLMHVSGEFLSGRCNLIPVKNDPQSFGSACSYFRRYAFSAITGIAADDDGNSASTASPYSAKPVLVANQKTVDYLAALKATKTLPELASCWQMIPAELRKTYEHTKNDQKTLLTPKNTKEHQHTPTHTETTETTEERTHG
jgi:hypothetical protein